MAIEMFEKVKFIFSKRRNLIDKWMRLNKEIRELELMLPDWRDFIEKYPKEKVKAIMILRCNYTSMGLVEAKRTVERYLENFETEGEDLEELKSMQAIPKE